MITRAWARRDSSVCVRSFAPRWVACLLRRWFPGSRSEAFRGLRAPGGVHARFARRSARRGALVISVWTSAPDNGRDPFYLRLTAGKASATGRDVPPGSSDPRHVLRSKPASRRCRAPGLRAVQSALGMCTVCARDESQPPSARVRPPPKHRAGRSVRNGVDNMLRLAPLWTKIACHCAEQRPDAAPRSAHPAWPGRRCRRLVRDAGDCADTAKSQPLRRDRGACRSVPIFRLREVTGPPSATAEEADCVAGASPRLQYADRTGRRSPLTTSGGARTDRPADRGKSCVKGLR